MRIVVERYLKPVLLVFFIFVMNFGMAQAHPEHYDVKLARLNNVQILNSYIDSLIKVNNIRKLSANEVFLVNNIIEYRFFHSYCRYSYNDNFLAYLAGKFVWSDLSAIVIPDDILKHPEAACSQQAIVMMEVLKNRGYKVRQLKLNGHFILEVFYDNAWRVFDPNKEPSLKGFAHETIKNRLKNGDLNKAYSRMSEAEFIRMYKITQVGRVNEFPAQNARLFHLVTKFISQYIVIFLAGFLLSIWFGFKRLTKISRKKKKTNFMKVSECQESALAN